MPTLRALPIAAVTLTVFCAGVPGASAVPSPVRVSAGSPQVPSFAIDARGALYAVWQDGRFSGGARDQVLVTSSRDGGVHWSPGRRLGGPKVGGILPTVAARGDGVVAVLYLELAGGAPISARYRVAISSDGGRRFRDGPVSRSFPLTDAPQLKASPLVPGGYFLGDYMGLAPLGPGTFGALFVVAQRATDNKTEVYYDEVS